MIIPILLDTRPACQPALGAPRSVLLAPWGPASLARRLCDRLAVISEQVYVLPAFEADDEYRAAITTELGERAVLLSCSRLLDCALHYEPSDRFLLVDAACFADAGVDFRVLAREASETSQVLHVVALHVEQDGAREYVHIGTDGLIRSIQRYYDGVTRLRSRGVCCTVLPCATLRGRPPEPIHSLLALRQTLARDGVPSRDWVLEATALDLREADGLYALAEHGTMILATRRDGAPLRELQPGVLVDPQAHVDPGARLRGPIIVQRGATVSGSATIIGPALIGAGARVGHGAIVAQSLVLPHTVVRRHQVLRHSVAGPRGEIPIERSCADDLRPMFQPPPLVLDDAAQVEPTGRSRRRRLYLAFKRGFDTLFAALGLIVLSPLLLATGLLVKLTSRGPVLFGHLREGLGGRPFRCWKFRTMVQDADRMQRRLYERSMVDGPQFKLPADPRVTPLGRILRLTNIDELPQLINVVLGQMSLVGPRPSPFRENQICVPWRRARLSVRPGITGLWQVCRHERSAGDFHQWIYYDMLYIRHMSLWLDIRILLATLLTAGGRFSVPLTWLIPSRQLREDADVEMLTGMIRRADESTAAQPLDQEPAGEPQVVSTCSS